MDQHFLNNQDAIKNRIREMVLNYARKTNPVCAFIVHDDKNKTVWVWFVNCGEHTLNNTQHDELNKQLNYYESMGYTHVLPEYKITK